MESHCNCFFLLVSKAFPRYKEDTYELRIWDQEHVDQANSEVSVICNVSLLDQ
jgi:hypothetical protein